MSNILVTGGAGFIGSTMGRHIINHTDNSVVNVDKLTYASNSSSLNSVGYSERYSFEQVDICDASKFSQVLNYYQPTAIMHLAAETHVDRSIDSPENFIQTNIVGTFNLLKTVKSYWNELSEPIKKSFRFHHISTDEVYGDLKDPDTFFTEETPYAPSSPYSASKAASDHLVRAWYRTYSFPVIITNCSNNYGPGQFPEKLIPLVISNALDGLKLPIYGAGDQVRDWLYVEDHARALYKVLVAGVVGETYNIGGHNEKKNIDVVKMICALLDELVPSNQASYADQITHVSDRPGHDLRYAIDATKIKKELGWEPVETFESGLRKTVEWYIANRAWCKEVKSQLESNIGG